MQFSKTGIDIQAVYVIIVKKNKSIAFYARNMGLLYKEVTLMGKVTPIPIGVEFYKNMVSEGYYYVDKTLLIHDLLEKKIQLHYLHVQGVLEKHWHKP